VQGQLRDSEFSVEIRTECAQCKKRMRFAIDHQLNYSVLEGGSEPLVFEPDVDWGSFSDPNIIDGY
jgi:hypothetical protein